jgi:hypothetical protein
VEFRFPENRVDAGGDVSGFRAIEKPVFYAIEKVRFFFLQDRLTFLLIPIKMYQAHFPHFPHNRMGISPVSPGKHEKRLATQNLTITPPVVYQGHLGAAKAEITRMKGHLHVDLL